MRRNVTFKRAKNTALSFVRFVLIGFPHPVLSPLFSLFLSSLGRKKVTASFTRFVSSLHVWGFPTLHYPHFCCYLPSRFTESRYEGLQEHKRGSFIHSSYVLCYISLVLHYPHFSLSYCTFSIPFILSPLSPLPSPAFPPGVLVGTETLAAGPGGGWWPGDVGRRGRGGLHSGVGHGLSR